MTVYGDFDEAERRLLRASLQAAAVAISTASPGRSEETASEGFAAASYILDHRAEQVSDPLVSSLIYALDERVKAGDSFPDFIEATAAPGAEQHALETLAAVVLLLDARATPEEAAGYKAWLLGIAEAAAGAGKEDQGLLGMGGVLVNDAERAALAQIAEVLGIPPTAS